MKDSVKKWYKDVEARLDVAPPSSVWEHIQGEINDPVKDWYTSHSKNLETSLPDELWNNIETSVSTWPLEYLTQKEKDLNVIVPNKIWEHIVINLDKSTGEIYQSEVDNLSIETDPKIWPKVSIQLSGLARSPYSKSSALQASIFVFIFIVLPFFVNSPETYADRVVTSMSPSLTGNASSVNLEKSPLQRSNSIALTNMIATVEKEQYLTTEQSLVNTNLVDYRYINLQERLDLTKSNNYQLHRPFSNAPRLPLSEVSPISITVPIREAKAPRQRPQLANWSLGPFAYFSGSSLMNPFTRQVILHKDIDGGPNYNLSYGISLSKAINKRSQLIVDLICNDNKTQVVKDLTGSSPVESITQLNYTTASALYKYNLFINKSHRVRMPYFGFSAGPFASINSGVTETRNGEEVNFIQDGYRKLDAGIVTAIDFSNPIGSHFTWAIGARMQSGVVNIFKGTHKMPAHFFRTYTTEFGLFTRLTFDIH